MNLKKTIRNSVLKRAIIPVWILLGVLNYIMSAPSRHDEMERVYEEQAKALGLSEPLFHVRSVITMVIPWVVVGIIVLLVTLYICRGLIMPQATKLGKSIKRYMLPNSTFAATLDEANEDLNNLVYQSKGIRVGKDWLVGRVWPFGYKAVSTKQLIGVYRCDFTYKNYKVGSSRVEYNILFLDSNKKETKVIVGNHQNREDVYFYFFNAYPNILHGNYEDYINTFVDKTEMEKDILISKIQSI